MNSKIFFEDSAVGDLFGFHVGDGIGNGLSGIGGEAVWRIDAGDAFERDLRFAN